jgi:hypothetical protein
MSVTMHSCTCQCSDRSAIATGRTYEDSVTRHRKICRRRARYVKTLSAGRVLSDANERARPLASSVGNTIGPRKAPNPATPALPTPEARGRGVPTCPPSPACRGGKSSHPRTATPPSRSPEQHRDTRLPVRILTPPLFFVPFPRVGRAVGYLVRRTGKQPKRPTPVANFRRRLQNFPAWGFLVIRFFYINCKDALIIPGNSISRAPALLKQ